MIAIDIVVLLIVAVLVGIFSTCTLAVISIEILPLLFTTGIREAQLCARGTILELIREASWRVAVGRWLG